MPDINPLTILQSLSDGHTRQPDWLYAHFSLTGEYDPQAAQLDSTCLRLLDDGLLSEPDGAYRGFAITEAGNERLDELRSEQEQAARQAAQARPKQKAMFT